MTIRELRVANLRSHELMTLQFDPHTTIVVGKNGTGKTSLLEGIYFLLQGTSFRGSDREMIAHDSTRTDVVLIATNEDRRSGSLQINSDGSIKKTFVIAGRKTSRLPAASRLPVVLFEPDELRLLTSSPERRRRFFDTILTHLYPQYSAVLNRYHRILMQRNELLKKRDQMAADIWNDQLFVWDMKLAEQALEITRQRREFVVLSNTSLSEQYSYLAGSTHRITVSYYSSLPDDNYQQQLINTLYRERLADSYRGHTGVGPHRDDFVITLDGHLATETASRGELRTIMLAYKLLEISLQLEITGKKPLILLDDVFSELDISREHKLTQALLPYQTVITSTDLRHKRAEQTAIIKL